MNEAEKEQALKLSGLYKELAEKGTWFEVNDIVGVWQKTDICPTLNSTLSEWRVADKPVEKKIIDLSKYTNSIDMEFTNCDEDWDVIGGLDGIFGSNHPYYKLNGGSFECCRVRQNHIHYYNGAGNPLPDGLLVRVYFLDYDNMPPYDAKSQNINWDGLYNVKGFQVISTLPEYKYGWEK